MRLVQVSIPAGKREAMLSVLEELDIDYVMTDETSGREYTAVVYFPLPVKAVEPVLDRIHEIGLDEQAYTVTVAAETVVSRQFERLEEKYAEEEENPERIARQELHAKAEELMPERGTFAVMTVVSAVVAASGLFMDSAAVVVGSMIIAPLLGPAIAASVGTVTDDPELFSQGLKLQVYGVLLAVAGAAGFALIVKNARLVPPGQHLVGIPQIRSRLSPDFLELAVALGAGIAGALSLSTGVSTAIVGALIAAALIPPVAIVGIGIAYLRPNVMIGSAVLVLVNLISINFAALATLWYMGYRPESWRRVRDVESRTVKRLGVLAAAILVLSVFLGGVTYTSYQEAQFEDRVNGEVATLVEAEENGELQVLDVQVQYDTDLPFRSPERVVVTIGRTEPDQPPDFADRLQRRLAATTGERVSVQVRIVQLQVAEDT